MANRYGLGIRAAAASDAAGIVEMMAGLGHGHAAALATRLTEVSLAGNGAALLAMKWGPPTGLVALHWYRTLTTDLPVAQIDILLVSRDERRRGVGRLLIKAASQAARTAGCGSLLLSAPLNSDESLEAFCDATGFAATGAFYARTLRKKD